MDVKSFQKLIQSDKRARLILMAIGSSVATIFVLFVILSFLQKSQPKSGSGETARAPNLTDTGPLENLESAELQSRYEQLEITPGMELVVQVDRIKQRLDLTDFMILRVEEPETVRFGLIAKLELLTLWSTLNTAHQMDQPQVREDLVELANQNLDNDDKEVAGKAHLALALVGTHDLLRRADGLNVAELDRHFDQSIKLLTPSPKNANQLLNVAKLVLLSGDKQQANRMLDKIDQAYRTSENMAVGEIATQAYDLALFSGMDINGLAGKIQAGDQLAAEEFKQQLRHLLASRRLSTRGLETLLSVLESMVQTGRLEFTRETLQLLSDARGRDTESEQWSQAVGQLEKVRRRIDAVGTVFQFDGLLDLSDQIIDPGKWMNRPVVILYWSPDNSAAVKRVASFSQFASRYRRTNVVFLAVYPTPESVDPQTREFVAKYSREASNVQFCRINMSSKKGREFWTQMVPPFLPYMIQVDERHQLQTLNPHPRILEAELDQLLPVDKEQPAQKDR